MIFTRTLFSEEYDKYINHLNLFSFLSPMFSDSNSPYVHYRMVENAFCNCFNAINISRSDTAFDAIKSINGVNYGIGIKTFNANINKNGIADFKQEKIAEFNKDSIQLNSLNIKKMALKIAELRNARINSAILEYGIQKTLYHCIIRYHENDANKSGKILLKEFPYKQINIKNIICTDEQYKPLTDIQSSEYPVGNLFFTDGEDKYSFYISKSTLFKKFDTSISNGIVLSAQKNNDPTNELIDWFLTKQPKIEEFEILTEDYVILPLYSLKSETNAKYVPEKSGLNQWNAGGRKRNFGEMYIPIPSFIHKHFNGFFPPKDEKFILITPNNKEISVKLCQDGSKALMSNPNHALSEWFHPLLIKDNKESIVTYDDLIRISKDSVKVEKVSEGKYKFSLAPLGSWEKFKKQTAENINI